MSQLHHPLLHILPSLSVGKKQSLKDNVQKKIMLYWCIHYEIHVKSDNDFTMLTVQTSQCLSVVYIPLDELCVFWLETTAGGLSPKKTRKIIEANIFITFNCKAFNQTWTNIYISAVPQCSGHSLQAILWSNKTK